MIGSLDGMEVLIVFVLGYVIGAGGMVLLNWVELNKGRLKNGRNKKNF